MKIAIVGTGAMGSVYAGLLADAGHEVWAIDAWKEHVDAMRTNGLRVQGASGDRVVRLHATTETGEVGVAELVILATKAFDVETAAAAARSLVGPETVVLSIQNGLGGPDRAAGELGEERVVVGVVAGFGASIVAPGHVHHNGWELVGLGERRGAGTPRLERVAEAWRAGGFRVKVFDDVAELIWTKLLCNVCYSGTCTVLERTIGEVIGDESAFAVAAACATEAYDVARASGIQLAFSDPVRHVREFGEKIPGARPSMLLDVMAGRRCEIDVINGAIPRAAEAVGLRAPVNETISGLVRAKEAASLGS